MKYIHIFPRIRRYINAKDLHMRKILLPHPQARSFKNTKFQQADWLVAETLQKEFILTKVIMYHAAFVCAMFDSDCIQFY